MGRSYQVNVENFITWKQVPFNIKAVGKNIKWRRGIENLGKQIKMIKMGYRRISSCRELLHYTPLLQNINIYMTYFGSVVLTEEK